MSTRILTRASTEIVHTGKVAIGIAHVRKPPRELGQCAEQIQTLLIKPIYIDTSIRARIGRAWASVRLTGALALANLFNELKG
jgi:hypothetical protein